MTRLDNLIFHYNVECYSGILKWKYMIWMVKGLQNGANKKDYGFID